MQESTVFDNCGLVEECQQHSAAETRLCETFQDTWLYFTCDIIFSKVPAEIRIMIYGQIVASERTAIDYDRSSKQGGPFKFFPISHHPDANYGIAADHRCFNKDSAKEKSLGYSRTVKNTAKVRSH